MAHNLSRSPRSNPAFSDPENYYGERDDGDDVFSNPDTAELEARSDATGATSPDRATSPVVASPQLRGRSALAPTRNYSYTDDEQQEFFDAQDDADGEEEYEDGSDGYQSAVKRRESALKHQHSRESQITQATLHPSDSNQTPTPSLLGIRSPAAFAVSRSPSSAQRPIFTPDPSVPLPAANELPSDPAVADRISTLFAHPPAPSEANSPALSSIRLPGRYDSPVISRIGSNAGSPISERAGFQWASPSAAAGPLRPSRSASRGPIRPVSPDRQKTIMPAIALRTGDLKASAPTSVSAFDASTNPSNSPVVSSTPSRTLGGFGLGLSSPIGSVIHPRGSMDTTAAQSPKSRITSGSTAPSTADSLPVTVADESSIFERDIEHRDARHVLSKSEAVDVAIPPVLDDAVEAIIEGGEQPLEIVSPLPSASPAPLPLSAVALSAHSLSSSTVSMPGSSPLTRSSSPPMSSSGILMPNPGEAPPPGSIAAQIAERLAPSRPGDEASGFSPERVSHHRRTRSSETSSVAGSSVANRSPAAGTASVEQVLEGSGYKSGGIGGTPQRTASTRVARDLSPAQFSPSPQRLSTVMAGSPLQGRAASTSSRPMSTQHQPQASPAAAAGHTLPSLPLPNPFRAEPISSFRAHSPSASMSGLSEAHAPAPMSMSLDGAVIPSSEAAIKELSLDSMADVLAEADSIQPLPAHYVAGNSPVVQRKQLPNVDSPAMSPHATFERRDTQATITAATAAVEAEQDRLKGANALTAGEAVTIPGGLPDEPATLRGSPIVDSTSAVPQTRRLSFFSYADIINETPACVVDFDTSVQNKTMEAESATSALNNSVPIGGSIRPETANAGGEKIPALGSVGSSKEAGELSSAISPQSAKRVSVSVPFAPAVAPNF